MSRICTRLTPPLPLKYYEDYTISCTHVHDAEHEDADEEPVCELEQAVVLSPDPVHRGSPHRDRAESSHPTHGGVDALGTKKGSESWEDKVKRVGRVAHIVLGTSECQ